MLFVSTVCTRVYARGYVRLCTLYYNNKNNIINTNIANEYKNKNVKEFWKCVNK